MQSEEFDTRTQKEIMTSSDILQGFDQAEQRLEKALSSIETSLHQHAGTVGNGDTVNSDVLLANLDMLIAQVNHVLDQVKTAERNASISYQKTENG